MKWIRQAKAQLNSWAVWSFVVIVILLLPHLSIASQFFSGSSDNWDHIRQYLLMEMINNTVMLVIFTGLFAVMIGISAAWIISAFDFPLRRFLRWGLVLPLTIPPYIGAYTYHGILNYTGFIQTSLRNSFDIQLNQRYFDIMTIPGAIFIFTICLFPYVYTVCRAFLANQSAALVENARLLGSQPLEIFFRIILPISRAAIVGGVSLVALEVINDYGVVKYFGIQTFTTGIFQTWFAMDDLNSAVRLSGSLMIIVIFLLLLERIMRGRKQFSFAGNQTRPLQPIRLKGWKAWAATLFSGGIFTIAFLIPFLQLVRWAWMTYQDVVSLQFLQLIWNSLLVSGLGAMAIVVVAVIIANSGRLNDTLVSRIYAKITLFGYSIPGAVIAIGVITLFIAIDRSLNPFYEWLGISKQLVISTSLFLLLFAYTIRFLAVGFNSIESGFTKIGNTYTEASRTLGMSVTETFFKVDLRMIKGAIAGGFILSFVDILKELPLTLILQPFNFYTLATKAFQYASDERIQEAALASILIILISAVCIYILQRLLERELR